MDTAPDAITSHYISDRKVDERVDLEIRCLLSRCFTKPEHARFKSQRFFYEPYPHRWILRDSNGVIVAHAGIHDRVLIIEDLHYDCGGIADVCVHPDHRRKGILKRMMAELHAWLITRDRKFSILFGDPLIYASSGYRPVSLYLESASSSHSESVPALTAPLSDVPWPLSPPRMSGGLF